jgi:peptidoglycan/xylan/chitin deacetylase (PgdA/CDA1 family)
MKDRSRQILFGIDLEEFDLPEEYGHPVPLQQKLETSYHGITGLSSLMDQFNIRSTIFTTAFWAGHYPDLMKLLASKHEIGSHSFYHSSFELKDLALSRNALQSITGKPVYGLRMPRFRKVSKEAVSQAGYSYDSSLHPTWMPGRYFNLFKQRTFFKENGLWELPLSVSPWFRIPVFWLAFKNFPFSYYKKLCRNILEKDGYLVLYTHPWEFADLSSFQIPGYTKQIDGDELLNRLEKLFTYLSPQGEFISHWQLLSQKQP